MTATNSTRARSTAAHRRGPFGARPFLCCAAALVALLPIAASCGGDSTTDPEPTGAAGRSTTRASAPGDGSIPSASFDLEAALGRDVGASRSPNGLGDDEPTDAFGVRVPVPPLLPGTGLVITNDGLIAHARGARLHRARDVVEGDQVHFSARLRNLSPTPLRLTRIEGECKCIDARGYRLVGEQRVGELWPGDEVDAGADFEIVVHLDTTDRAGDLQLEGILDYRGADAPLKFGVVADVRGVYRVDPPEALVTQVMLGRARTVRATLTSPLASRFRLELDDVALPRFVELRAEPLDANAAGYARAYALSMLVTQNAPDAPLVRTFDVPITVVAAPTTEHGLEISYPRSLEVGYRTELPVAFVQRIKGPDGKPKVVPGTTLAFDVIEPGATAERRVTLTSQDDWRPEEEPAVYLVEGGNVGREPLPEGCVEMQWRVVRGTYHLDVRVTNAADDIAGPMRGQLQVRLDHPDVPVARISLSSLFR